MADKSLLMVFSNAADGQDDAFNTWYDEVHVPEVLAVDGVVAAQRYSLAIEDAPAAEGAPEVPPSAHRYLAVYELKGDPNAIMNDFVTQVMTGQMVLSETLDMTTIGMTIWSPRGARVEAQS